MSKNRYFESKTPHIKIYASNGKVVTWETYDGNVGWQVSGDSQILAVLDKSIKNGTGGDIREITEKEYESAKKKVSGLRPWSPLREHVSSEGIQSGAPVPLPVSGEAVVVPNAELPSVPDVDGGATLKRRGAGRRGKVA